jgi:DNA-binding LytR/AlgR family response regulator
MERRRLSVLIVDDEPIARQILREELEALREVVIVGEADNGSQALKDIRELAPDVVFLDLQMPAMDGFEVLRKLKGGHLPVIVIVTAFDQYPVQAFEAGALDYLLKPVSEARLRKAVERALNLRDRPLMHAELRVSGGPKIVGRRGGDYILLDADEILAFQAEGELVWIVTSENRLMATQSLRSLEEHLPQQQFQRVHRNALVNVNHVRKLSALSSQRWLVTLSNATQLVVSKRQAHSLRRLLRW